MNASSVLTKALLYGGVVTAVIAIAGAVIGYFASGTDGVVSALVAAIVTAVFLGLTAVSILVASRVTQGKDSSTAYFGIVLAVWFLKLVLFVVVAMILRDQPWLNSYVFFGVVIVTVVGSLLADAVALQRTRVSYVGDVALPGDARNAVASAADNEATDGK
jgi:hypothetical protein